MQEVDDPAGEAAQAGTSGRVTPDDAPQPHRAHRTPELDSARADGTAAGTAHATQTLASVIHTHGAPSTMTGAERLDAVLGDLVQRHHNISPGGPADPSEASQTGTHPPTPGSQLSELTSTTPGGGMGVTAGLALGVTGAGASPGGKREGTDREMARQEVQDLQRHVAVLHNVQQRGTSESMCAACSAVQAMVERNAEAKQCAPVTTGQTADKCQSARTLAAGHCAAT
jgi:hypothetical protein